MMAIKSMLLKRQNILALLLLVLIANMTLYYTSFGVRVLSEGPNGIVIGSMVDLAIVTPMLFLAWKQKWTVKHIVFAIASGLILVRFVIPMEYLAPYVAVTWIGFALEGAIVLFEVFLLFLLVKHLPSAVRHVRNSSLPTIFSFPEVIEKQVATNAIIKAICTEILMFYYAFGSWGKQLTERDNTFTIHKNSSLIALYMMAIHSILLETIAVHWWLHSKFPIVSIVLLILNIYSVIFLLGNMQAIRLNPIHISDGKLYFSFGLLKRMKVNIEDIAEVIDDPVLLQQKLPKNTIDFIARDLEDVSPHMIVKLKRPVKATFLMGIEKEYTSVALRVDEEERLKNMIGKYK